VASGRVEVSQERTIPLLIRLICLLRIVALSINEIRNDQLNCTLCASVGVRGANGAVFWDGDHVGDSCRIAVYGRRGGEDDVGDIVLLHAAQESDGSAYIHAVIFERDLAGFADSLVKG
jgi:hypothetical protein